MADVKARARQAHRSAVEWNIEHVAKFLRDQLGAKLVAHMMDVDVKTVAAWTRSQRPRPDAQDKLRAVFQIFQLLQSGDDDYTVRAWFIGMNPQLNDQAPANAIREDRLADALVAAQAYCAGG